MLKGRYLIDIRDAPPTGPRAPGCLEMFFLIVVGVVVLLVISGGLR